MKYGIKVISSEVVESDYMYSTTSTKKRCVFWKSSRGVEAWCSGDATKDLNTAFRSLPREFTTSSRTFHYAVEVYEE